MYPLTDLIRKMMSSSRYRSQLTCCNEVSGLLSHEDKKVSNGFQFRFQCLPTRPITQCFLTLFPLYFSLYSFLLVIPMNSPSLVVSHTFWAMDLTFQDTCVGSKGLCGSCSVTLLRRLRLRDIPRQNRNSKDDVVSKDANCMP